MSYWLGLMSGTSMDSVDAVLVSFGPQSLTVHATHSLTYPDNLRQRLISVTRDHGTPDELGELDTLVGQHFARTASELIAQAGIAAHEISGIGSHGQTVRHQPSGSAPFSMQIGCAALIAEATGVTTVSDFRSRDLAAGGQGAPLVPAFHKWLFESKEQDRCILNLGGIANITWLPAGHQNPIIGFDTGPANALLDAWCLHQTGRHYDEDGHLASEGTTHQELLASMLSDAYFSKPAPKSTGKERFNLDWVRTHVQRFPDLAPEDVQRTLLQLTVTTILQQLPQQTANMAIYACGGGTFNTVLMNELRMGLGSVALGTTAELGLDSQWVEPVAFAWLARQTLKGLPGNVPEVTGASGERVLGAIYPA
ncbi:MAG: anhydro-N-acetylmuramic acid kinase [Marinobacter sp.]|uniref:anhydro-N-acetylmuramic acid kinase n=1 Tax=unclassified Marinobacter TaxID=83889 RepID=UPI00273C9887|nr:MULTISPECIES: anhydro-N-acetylmuramic acid kinase [unclassified Marinobacter]MDP4548261.1 anhydro-N-acetylmuramic acid kinase [Marinobacter sp. MDS2]